MIKMVISPELPYLYVTSSMWLNFAKSINRLFVGLGYDVCVLKTGICKITSNCLTVDYNLDIGLTLNIMKDSGSEGFKVSRENMLLEGPYFGDQDTNTCYIPVFDSGIHTGRDKWNVYVGNLFIQDYYIVFDDQLSDML